jgi:hypothetical protein
MAHVSAKWLVEEPCINLAGQLRDEAENQAIASDIAITLVSEYLSLVEDLASPNSSIYRQEYAYGRLLGARGMLCRLCPVHLTDRLPREAYVDWRKAELLLQDYLVKKRGSGRIIEVALNVEARWTESAERFIRVIFSQLEDADVFEQMGYLKGIDTIALHLAQREMLRAEGYLLLPVDNAQAVKLRLRLLAIHLALHRSAFRCAFGAIQSYRESFRIYDPLAYPWWFVDCSLTEKQLHWTYRRLADQDMCWRFS